MKKYDCSKTLDYSHEVDRMCHAYNVCSQDNEVCPLKESACYSAMVIDREKIDIVQKWSDENPEEPKLTKRDLAFLKAFGGCYRDRKIRKWCDGSVYYVFDGTATTLAKGMFEDMEIDTEMTFEELLELETGEEE